ncbi:MAG: DUF374 domain-containing protein [Gammaproteobacteria bacterium]|nr:DUF374 domain-containing protein [Gammaproteobacteria bacterium]
MLRMHEALGYLNHALANAPVKRVVFGLDFFMFNGEERTNPSYDSTLVGRRLRPWDYVYQPLLTKDALLASITTAQVSHETPDRREFLPNGYRPGTQVFYHLADYPKLHNYTNYVFLSKDPSQTPYYGRFKLSDEAFRDFEQFVKTCRSHNIECEFFITPAHALLDGEGIRLAGLTEVTEEWKRRLVEVLAKNGLTLWDFSGYNSITTETVRSPMKYYWDSSHFTEATADLILSRMFGDGEAMARIEEGLGFRVARGSSGKGGARALVEMIKAQREDRGLNSCLAIDGSRGPRGIAQLGTITLAQKTGSLLLPVAASTDHCWVWRKSWDRTVIPKPGATVTVQIGTPIEVPPKLDETQLEALRLRLETAIVGMHRELDRTTGYHDAEPLQRPA